MSCRAVQLLLRSRWFPAIASTCLTILASMCFGAIAGQPGAGHPDKAAAAENIGVCERIKRVRAEIDNQVSIETTPRSRWLLAQWYNFGNFRPAPVPYGVPRYYLPRVPIPQRAVPPPQIPQRLPYPGGYPVQPPMWRNF
jgi:hypothetical protein